MCDKETIHNLEDQLALEEKREITPKMAYRLGMNYLNNNEH